LRESWADPWNLGIPLPADQREQQSKTMSKKIQAGEMIPWYQSTLTGIYKSNKCKEQNVVFRSSYELCVHIHLDAREDVVEYNYEPFSIEYESLDGIVKNYNPDFLFKTNDGKLYLLEVKNDFLMKEESTLLKLKCAEDYCLKNSMTFLVWSNKQIGELNVNLEEYIKDTDRITLHKKDK
jgi:hypothetical protein